MFVTGFLKIILTSDFLRLVYFRYPTDLELRKLAGLPIPKPKAKPVENEHKKGKRKKKWEEPADDKTFNVPRNLDIQVIALFFLGLSTF